MVNINEDRAKSYCESFNQLKVKYVATKENCQRFVSEFIANLLPDSAIANHLPIPIEETKTWLESSMSLCTNSLSNVASAAIVRELLPRLGTGALDNIFSEAIKQINLNGFGIVSLLKEGPIKEWMVQKGKTLVLTSLQEGIENMLNASRGAFTWWNLLQIPVELIVGSLMRKNGFTDLQAYGGKKLASCLTAVGVGLISGGPWGCLASLAFWIASEIVATLIKLLLAKLIGKAFTEKFGESETWDLIKSVYKFFEVKIKSGLNASLIWMEEYMKSTQCGQKKLE